MNDTKTNLQDQGFVLILYGYDFRDNLAKIKARYIAEHGPTVFKTTGNARIGNLWAKPVTNSTPR